MTSEPAWTPGRIAATAESMIRWSGWDPASSMTGTMSTTTSAARAASAPSSGRSQTTRAVGLGDELGDARFLADVRLPGVDARDDARIDVHGDDAPAMARELGGQG